MTSTTFDPARHDKAASSSNQRKTSGTQLVVVKTTSVRGRLSEAGAASMKAVRRFAGALTRRLPESDLDQLSTHNGLRTMTRRSVRGSQDGDSQTYVEEEVLLGPA